jgi:antitoxin (DNA-binding transcriptional repressor) of toxin-antitoxin stability system
MEIVRFAGLLRLVEAGETVQAAAEGAPVQAKATL